MVKYSSGKYVCLFCFLLTLVICYLNYRVGKDILYVSMVGGILLFLYFREISRKLFLKKIFTVLAVVSGGIALVSVLLK